MPTSLPSFEDVDRGPHTPRSFTPIHNDNGDSESDETPSQETTTPQSPMQFVSDYFHQSSASGSSSENEEKLAAGLDVPDLDDVDSGREGAPASAADDGDTSATYITSVAAQTLTSVTLGAASGLSRLAGYIRRSDAGPEIEDVGAVDGEEDPVGEKSGSRDVANEGQTTDRPESSPTSLGSEFEFVEHSDLSDVPYNIPKSS